MVSGVIQWVLDLLGCIGVLRVAGMVVVVGPSLSESILTSLGSGLGTWYYL